MIELLKVIKGIYDCICVPHFDFIRLSEDSIRTRGNNHRLLQKHCHYDEGIPEIRRAPMSGVSPISDVAAAVSRISLALSPKSTDIDVPGPTDTDMSGHGVASTPQVEMADKGDTLILKTSSISSMSGVP